MQERRSANGRIKYSRLLLWPKLQLFLALLDPLPTKPLNDNMVSVIPIITYITNASLENAVMPVVLKQAIVRPLLKKKSLDKDILNNYCPVSNLSKLSKVIEKVFVQRIISHISDQ